MVKHILPVLFLTYSINANAQRQQIDTIPFSLETRLLVFKGKINGKDVNFAFDTGAEAGIANTKTITATGITTTGHSRSVADANLKSARLEKGIIAELSIGSFNFENVRCFIQDMQYLYCNNLYLLSADVIRQLNWVIDFDNQLIYCSKAPFPFSADVVSLPVKYASNKPIITFSIDGQPYKNVMIDMGYTAKITLPVSDKNISKLIDKKSQAGKVNYNLSAAMGANGIPEPDTVKMIVVDSILIGRHYFRQVIATCKPNTNIKLGLGFFSGCCSRLIINNTDALYGLLIARDPVSVTGSYEISVDLRKGKLVVTGKNLSPNSVGNSFEMNEEIVSLDDRTASSFKDPCDFSSWYLRRNESFTVKKLNGQLVKINKVKLPLLSD